MCANAFACMFVHVDPLLQTPTYPRVTFYGVPVEKQFTSSGGYADFDNGVTVSVTASAVSAEAVTAEAATVSVTASAVSAEPVTVSVTASAMSAEATGLVSVQPCLAPKSVFVLPEGVVSASPSYLISGKGISGEVILEMEHHVQVSSREEADKLSFFEAELSPTRSSDSEPVYRYKEVPKDRTEFTPGENKGRLKLVTRLMKFFKIGRKRKLGMYMHACIYIFSLAS